MAGLAGRARESGRFGQAGSHEREHTRRFAQHRRSKPRSALVGPGPNAAGGDGRPSSGPSGPGANCLPGRPDRNPHQLPAVARHIGSTGGRFAAGRAGAGPGGGHHATDFPGLLFHLPGHLARGRYSGADIPAGTTVAARRPCEPPHRHPRQRAGCFAGERARSDAGGAPAPGPGTGSSGGAHTRGPDRCRPGASAGRGGGPGGRRRLHPVHVGQHRATQGRGTHTRQPAGQHPRHGHGDRSHAPGCVCQLAAAVPRHGPDRRLAREFHRGLPAGGDVAAGFFGSPQALAGSHLKPRRHAVGRPQLRLRAVPEPDRRCRTGWARPEPLAAGLQRGRGGEPGHGRALCSAFCGLRAKPLGDDTGVRAGRSLGGPAVSAAGPGPAH